jgi:HSP20 family protein
MTFVKVNNQATKNFDGFMKDIFNEIPASFSKTFREDVFGFPPVNINESGNAYHLEVAIPGMEKTDFTIKLDGVLLSISAAKKEEVKDENLKSIRKEFSNKAFNRSFTLDEKIDAANIVAKYENGILKVDLPKKEETKTASKEITIQ